VSTREPGVERLVRGRIVTVAAFAAVIGPVAAAEQAPAATTVGGPLHPATDVVRTCPGRGCFIVQSVLGGRVLRAPFTGIAVRWRLRASSGLFRLRVVRPVGNDELLRMRYRYLGASAGATVHGGGTTVLRARVHVARGDLVGIQALGLGAEVGMRPVPFDSSAWEEFDTRARRNSIAISGGTTNGQQLLYNADIERDRDHDGYGDQTQDRCPRLRAVHSRRC
jgi:hypothetical protein